MAFEIAALRTEHAQAAAAIHAAGQPGTFLTRLGPAFLRALYAEMAASPYCSGWVALVEGRVVGVTVGARDSGAVFRDLLVKRGLRLVGPVLGALARHPGLAMDVVRTVSYPASAEAEPGEAELLFIGTMPDCRGEGVGRALFERLAAAMQEQGMRSMGLTVDAANATAQRFYRRNGMHASHDLELYGKRMYWYVLPLQTAFDDERAGL